MLQSQSWLHIASWVKFLSWRLYWEFQLPIASRITQKRYIFSLWTTKQISILTDAHHHACIINDKYTHTHFHTHTFQSQLAAKTLFWQPHSCHPSMLKQILQTPSILFILAFAVYTNLFTLLIYDVFFVCFLFFLRWSRLIDGWMGERKWFGDLRSNSEH